MTIKKWDESAIFYGEAPAHAGAEATYTTIFTILTAPYGTNFTLGLRGRAVYRNVGGNTGYGGYAETVGVYDDANGLIQQVSGNGNTFGHVGSVTGLSLIVLKFVQNGANIDVQVSGLDTDSYKWIAAVRALIYQTA
jgi:hypothetical protein